jgi:branched-chain amino acid transport system substrate-binding protein
MARDQLENRPGIVTRRRVLTASAALGGAILAPAPLRFALAQSKPYKIGTLQPLSGGAAIIGKTALVGVQMATDRINAGGGIHGRKIELIVADYESKPDVGRRKAEKLAVEDNVDAHVGASCRMSASPACRSGRNTRSSTWSASVSTRR